MADRKNPNRRDFVRAAFPTAAILAAQGQTRTPAPWYRRTYRWGQTNITELDPEQYDIAWWRDYWKRTAIEGVIINAGGIVAYYPSKFPLHHRAEFLNGRDLYGELTEAAHKDGLVVMARMDSNRAAEDFFKAHPDWFARTAAGEPYRAADKYVACINSPYYTQYLPDVMREIINRSHPEGFTDNSWAGLGRGSICYCDHCRRSFGKPIPARANWDDSTYREWILWSYRRRTELWEFNNRVTRDAGGPDCIWSGMNSGSVTGSATSFRDLREIAMRADILMLDHQRREDALGFQQNGDTGKRVHGLMGWDKLAPESMALYQSGRINFRVASKPAAEARLWMIEGIAGGICPWWHHVGAYHEDRRMYRTAEPVMQWHKANEAYLVNRKPLATVGLLWSQRNTDFYGRDRAAELVSAPYEGFAQALIRARIPYLPVHVDDLERESGQLSTLVLPNVGSLSDQQCEAIRRFVARGGSLIATGDSSLFNEWGDARADFGLADVLGIHARSKPAAPAAAATPVSVNSYLRLHPELRGRVDGPRNGKEPSITEARHPVLAGFDETDLIAFGGVLSPLEVDPSARVLLTFVPEFPVFPPETSWMRERDTSIPGLVVREAAGGGGRVAYLAADLDRRYMRDLLPDHANLLANLVRWANKAPIPLRVEGAGLIDCHLYSQQQSRSLILHLVNLTNEAAWRAPVEELIRIGPIQVAIQLPSGFPARTARGLVSSGRLSVAIRGGWAEFTVPGILDHEVVVVS